MKRFGNQSKKIARWLRELWELDAHARLSSSEAANSATAERIAVLRRLIPTSMLRHYDHLKSRGKRSVAPIIRGVCGNCHLAFPSGVLASLERTKENLNLCVNCGAFVFVVEERSNGNGGDLGRNGSGQELKPPSCQPVKNRNGKPPHGR